VPDLTLSDGAVIRYEDRGSGRPLVLLHGVCMSSDFFREQVGPLSAAHRVITVDFRGHGRSPACDHGHTVAQYARDVHELIEDLALDDAVLVGWSMGSIVIWQYLRQFGLHRVAAQVVVSQGPSDLRRDDWPLGLLDLAELAEMCDAIQDDMAGAFADFAPAMFAEPLSEDERAHVLHEILQCRPTTATAILLSQTLPDARPVLEGLALPTLLAWGRDEKLIPVSAGEWLRDHVPGAELVLFERSGHCPMLEEPERFNDLVTGFVASL
jgi:pimeloyl-ACP methyl ester carboxylesterase